MAGDDRSGLGINKFDETNFTLWWLHIRDFLYSKSGKKPEKMEDDYWELFDRHITWQMQKWEIIHFVGHVWEVISKQQSASHGKVIQLENGRRWFGVFPNTFLMECGRDDISVFLDVILVFSCAYQRFEYVPLDFDDMIGWNCQSRVRALGADTVDSFIFWHGYWMKKFGCDIIYMMSLKTQNSWLFKKTELNFDCFMHISLRKVRYAMNLDSWNLFTGY